MRDLVSALLLAGLALAATLEAAAQAAIGGVPVALYFLGVAVLMALLANAAYGRWERHRRGWQ